MTLERAWDRNWGREWQRGFDQTGFGSAGLTVSISVPSSTSAASWTATFTFSEDVTGFVIDDISVTNGAASAFATVNASTYTATITPTTDGIVSVEVPADSAFDADTNGNLARTVNTAFTASTGLTTPILDWDDETADTTPDFTLEFGDEITNGDGFRLQVSASSDFSTIDYEGFGTIDAAGVLADEVLVAVAALANGTYYARARVEQGAVVSDWSNTETVTISATPISVTPVTTWVSAAYVPEPVINSDFGAEVQAGDSIRTQISSDSGFATITQDTSVVLDADDIVDGTLNVTLATRALGTWYVRTRVERGTSFTSWSATVSETIAAFHPSQLFANGEAGAVREFSDLTKLKQEITGAAATTAVAVDDVVGTLAETSGNGGYYTAPTTGFRPILRESGALRYLENDNAGSHLSLDTPGLGATSTEIVCLDHLTDTSYMLTSDSDGNSSGTGFVGLSQSGSTSTGVYGSAGAPTFRIDGADVAVGDRGILYAALDGAGPHVVTLENVDMSAWGKHSPHHWYSFHYTGGNVYPGMVIDRALTADERSRVETYFGNLAGLTI